MRTTMYVNRVLHLGYHWTGDRVGIRLYLDTKDAGCTLRMRIATGWV